MIFALTGPTGTGKSELSLRLAERWNKRGRVIEVINADAMQLYRGMDIGTAKLRPELRRGVPHHLIDVLDVTDEANVAQYQRWARDAITAVIARDAVPLLVGGSGLYLAAVLTDFQFPGTDRARRNHWESVFAERGVTALYDELRVRDPEAARAIGPHNGRRLVRALEVIDITGRPFTAGLAARATPWLPYRQVALHLDRSVLVARLDERVRTMWRQGLLDEVRSLLPLGLERGVTASRAIGYAQAIGHLHGRLSEAEAIAETQSLTRRYARRQVSWFRRDAATSWVDAAEANALDHVEAVFAERGADSMGQ